MVDELINELKELVREVNQLKKEMPDVEKYQPYYRIKISEATERIKEIRHHLKELDMKNRR
jgi:chromosome segregation ATPase